MEIKDLLRELVTDDIIKDVVEDCVEERIEHLFNYSVEYAIKQRIHDAISDKVDMYIKPEIDKVLENGVRVDNGWGEAKEYGSFDDYVRNAIYKELKSSWRLDEHVREAVDSKLKKYIEKALKQKYDDRADMVLEDLAKDILDGDKNERV